MNLDLVVSAYILLRNSSTFYKPRVATFQYVKTMNAQLARFYNLGISRKPNIQ